MTETEKQKEICKKIRTCLIKYKLDSFDKAKEAIEKNTWKSYKGLLIEDYEKSKAVFNFIEERPDLGGWVKADEMRNELRDIMDKAAKELGEKYD